MLGENVPERHQGLGMADILEENSWGTILCIHLYEHLVSCCEKEEDTAMK